jgi:uncharacterized protein YbgA (DUF1722 family)
MSDKKTTEQKLNEARVFHIAAEQLLPLVEERQLRSMEKLIAEFRSGQTNLITAVAQLDAYTTIIEEIRAKETVFNHLIDKHNKENN